jgi:hypothetical protein
MISVHNPLLCVVIFLSQLLNIMHDLFLKQNIKIFSFFLPLYNHTIYYCSFDD